MIQEYIKEGKIIPVKITVNLLKKAMDINIAKGQTKVGHTARCSFSARAHGVPSFLLIPRFAPPFIRSSYSHISRAVPDRWLPP